MSLMRLSTFWALHGALSAAEEPGPLARQVAAQWDHDPETLRLFRSSANAVYCFETDGHQRFLRIAADSERPRQLIEAEVDLLEWLLTRGLHVARPVRSRTGRLVETVQAGVSAFHTVAFDGLGGRELRIDELEGRHFSAWGAALGRLHATLRHCPPAVLERRPSRRDDLAQVRAFVPSNAPAVQRELNDLAQRLERLPVGHQHVGLIHGDFELDNLRWADEAGDARSRGLDHDQTESHGDAEGALGSLAMLDFDDCATYWYAADIAFALRDMFDSGARLDDASVGAFLEGYRAHFALDDDLVGALPLFSRLARLRSYATQVRALDLPDSSAQPEWLRRLRQKLEARAAAYVEQLG